MARFNFMVRLPGRAGSTFQNISASHESKDIVELHDALNMQDFILVDQFVHDRDGQERVLGRVILGTRNVGKVRDWREQREHGSEHDNG